jgi:hypothetical protein
MLYLLAAWGVLFLLSSVIGLGLLHAMQAHAFKLAGDRLIASLWLGTIALGVSLLATSLLFPLSPGVGALVAGCLCLLSWRSQSIYQELRQWYSHLRPMHGLLLAGLAIAVAHFMSRQVIWLDTGLYHYSTIRWLADFGIVPGVALLYSQLGFMSSWLALAAPLNPSIVGSHVTAVTDGFILLVAILHWFMSLNHLLSRKSGAAKPNDECWQRRCEAHLFPLNLQSFNQPSKQPTLSDWFALVFLTIIISLLVGTPTLAEILVSPSPDIPCLLLVGVVCWAILLICEANQLLELPAQNQTDQPPAFPPAIPQDNSQAVVLFLASGAFTIKLTALPLLAISGLFYLINNRQDFLRQDFLSSHKFSGCEAHKASLATSKSIFQLNISSRQWHHLLIGFSIAGLTLIPLISGNLIASGCPLFPSTNFCLDLPWSPLLEDVQASTRNTLNWTHWFPPPPLGQPALLWFVEQWFRSNRSNQILIGVVVSSLVLVGYVWRTRIQQARGQLWLLAIGGLGVAFLLVTSPLLRFVLGYLLVIPALAIALPLWKWHQKTVTTSQINHLSPSKAFSKAFFKITSGCGAGLALVFALKIVALGLAGDPTSPPRLLLPPALPAEEMVQKQVNAITYFTPKQSGALCWSSPLPCAFEVKSYIDLRNQAAGLRAGFVRKSL